MHQPPLRPLALATLVFALAALLAGCAAERSYHAGNELIAQDKVEESLLKYREALASDSSNLAYKEAYLSARPRRQPTIESGRPQISRGWT